MADIRPAVVQPSHRYGEFMHTLRQFRLEHKATAMLAKAGFFNPTEATSLEYFEDLFGEAEYLPVDAAACGVHGLRPTWHGRA